MFSTTTVSEKSKSTEDPNLNEIKDFTTSIPSPLPEMIIISSKDKNLEKRKDGRKFDSFEHSDIANYVMHKFLSDLEEQKDESSLELLREILSPLNTENQEEESENNYKGIKIYNPYTEQKEEIPIYEIKINETISLTPGDIVALAGDFYGIAKKPISFELNEDDQEKRFESAFDTLINNNPEEANQFEERVSNSEDKEEKLSSLQKIVAHIRHEAESHQEHADWTLQFKRKIAKTPLIPIVGITYTDIQYALESNADNLDNSFWHSPYFELSVTNFDHFGKEAQKAYLAGHRIAIRLAGKAGKAENKEEKISLLKQALLRELYACHFLTDLFAAGHIRTPRKELLNSLIGSKNLDSTPDLESVSSLNLTIAGFFAKRSHDRDGEKGIYVKSPKYGNWLAFGDGNYSDKRNKDNAKITCETVLIAFNDLIRAYRNNSKNNLSNEMLQLDSIENLQKYIPEADEKENNSHNPPLFIVDKDKNEIRCGSTIGNAIKEVNPSHLMDSVVCNAQHAVLIGLSIFNTSFKPKLKEKAEKAQNFTIDTANSLKNKFENAKTTCQIL